MSETILEVKFTTALGNRLTFLISGKDEDDALKQLIEKVASGRIAPNYSYRKITNHDLLMEYN